jgi:hypothetical protein
VFDECAELDDRGASVSHPRKELLASLSDLINARKICVSVLVTTRPGAMPQRRDGWPEIAISGKDADIGILLEQEIKRNERICKFDQEDFIKEKITDKAQGM